MGCRGQILIEDTGVFLYTHWGANRMVDDLKKALSLHKRWDDDEYLARIIFCQLVKDDIDGTISYGIGTSQHGDIEKLISINCQEETIEVNDLYMGTITKFSSFEDFISFKETEKDDFDEVFEE